MRIVLQLLESSIRLNLTILEDTDAIGKVKEINSMGHQDACLIFKHPHEYVLEDFLSHISIECRNRIIHHNYVCIGIYGTCQTASSFLPTRKVDTFLTDFSLISSYKNLEVAFKLARLQRLLVALRIELIAENNVVFNCLVLNPGALLNVGD